MGVDVKLDPVKDEARFYQLTLYAFNRQDTPQRQAFFGQLYRHSLAYGAIEDGELSSGFLAFPFETQFHQNRIPMRGISYVSSYPEDSGHGNITKLMHRFFEDCQADQVPLAYLAPFSFPFYRRFGFEQVFDRVHYHVQTRDVGKLALPDFAKTDEVSIKRESFAQAGPSIAAFHEAHPFNQGGGTIRSAWWQDYLTLKHATWEVATCLVAGKLEGYVIYSRDGNQQLSIQEFFWTSKTAYWQLLNFIARHKGTYAAFDYISGDPRPRIDAFSDPHVKKSMTATSEAYMMARIVDLPMFFKYYHVPTDRDFKLTLTVTDDFLPANNRTWQLTGQNGTIACQPTDDAAELTIDIRELTQILLGYRRAEDLMQLNLNTDQAAALNRLVQPNLVPMLWDYF